MAEEMRDPGRNVPLAMGIGTVAVVLIYLLMNVLYGLRPSGGIARDG